MTALVYPLATWRDGPRDKVWSERNAIAGVIEHSAEGYEAGLWSQLDGQAQVSWHFTVMQDGRVYQHYLLDQSPWHAGNKQGNITLIGIEHEGVKGEPLTEIQVAASVALTEWVAAQGGWTPARPPAPAQTLYEHHEVNPATTCPNGRIPWERYVSRETSPVDVITHVLSPTETTQAGRALGAAAGAALAGTDGRHVEMIIDIYTPIGYVDYRVRLKKEDGGGDS